MVDDVDLERQMREGLERRALDVDASVPVVRKARSGVRRRHAGFVVGLAAASVAAVAVVAALVNTSETRTLEDVVDRPAPTGWRTEYWADVKVEVPADWGYGDLPVLGRGDGSGCVVGASRNAEGAFLELGERVGGYVGRPVRADGCLPSRGTGDDPRLARLPYLWLGVDVAPGTIDLAGGFVQETVVVNGTSVTVGSDDAELRRRILDSAAGGELCLSEIDESAGIGHDAAAEGAAPTGMNVCVYRVLDRSRFPRVATLVHADRVGADAVASYLRERERAPRPRDLCPAIDYAEYDWVVLELVTDDGSLVDQDVAHLGTCPGIDLDPEHLSGLERVPVTAALAEPWLVGGIRAVVPQEALGLHR